MPAPPPPPPAPTFNLGAGSPDQGRGALLQSIRAGKPLKKTVTVDKSAPILSGKVQGEGSSAPNVNAKAPGPNTNVGNSINNGNPIGGLGGLFAGGMPKLKPTGMRNNLTERDNGNVSPNMGSATLPSVKRGPPPVPPPAAQKPLIFSPAAAQSADSGTNHAETPRSSFGKPTLAPKPPNMSPNASQQKPSPPPKKLSLATGNSVSRAQSMRVARSPAVLAPTPPSLHQSQDCLNEPMQRPMVNRVLRPPAARPPSPPSTRPAANGPAANGGPPIARVAPLPPCRAPSIPPPPPPLPHRSISNAGVPGSQAAASQPQPRLAPPVPPPPTPPTRGQSLQQQQRNGQSIAEFELRFADMFHSIATFPTPEPFRNLTKIYNSKSVAAAKQQAPQPPQRSVSNAGSTLGVRQLPQQQQQQQWQQQQNAASSAC